MNHLGLRELLGCGVLNASQHQGEHDARTARVEHLVAFTCSTPHGIRATRHDFATFGIVAMQCSTPHGIRANTTLIAEVVKCADWE